MRISARFHQLLVIVIYVCGCIILGVVQYGYKSSWPWENKTESWLPYVCLGGIITGWIAFRSGIHMYSQSDILVQRSIKKYAYLISISAFWLVMGLFFGGAIYLFLTMAITQSGNIILFIYLLFALIINNVVNLLIPSILVGVAVSLFVDPIFNSITKNNRNSSTS